MIFIIKNCISMESAFRAFDFYWNLFKFNFGIFNNSIFNQNP